MEAICNVNWKWTQHSGMPVDVNKKWKLFACQVVKGNVKWMPFACKRKMDAICMQT